MSTVEVVAGTVLVDGTGWVVATVGVALVWTGACEVEAAASQTFKQGCQPSSL